MSLQVGCLSFRQPYAGLVLNGLKTIETRWRPLLSEFENCTLAVHIAQKDWEGSEWREVLTCRQGMTCTQIDDLLDSGERFGRGVVAGLVEVGETWVYPDSLPREEMLALEAAALLTGLEEKHLTRLSFPRWLKEPMYARGHKDIWTIDIPLALLPALPPAPHRTVCA
ncbi:protein EOLA1 [Conger conger]|uniref:protein EOLA1 n=1 Tax=Conger conger TaxID=82655 RepID=UPI002A59DDC9|nr:protein EOLA1 [Conger conger]